MSSVLKHLDAILETGSIAAASRRLFLSQPALSQYVKRLEADYGITVFDRSQTPWRLTREGQRLIEAHRQMARIDRECRQYFDDLRGLKRGEIRIGSTAYRTATILNPVLSAFKAAHPEIRIWIKEGTTEEIADLAASGEVDCAFVITEMLTPELEGREIYSESVLVGLPPSHPYAVAHPAPAEKNFAVADFQALDGTPFIIMQKGQIFHSYFEKLCTRFRITLPVALVTQSILTVPALIATGVGGALIPSTIAEDCARHRVPLYSLGEVLPENRVSVAWKRGRYLSQAARVFISTVLEIYGSEDEKNGVG